MSDIGRRIRRYRLSRYAPPPGGLPRAPRWVWLLVALWIAWVGIASKHSLYRIWQLGVESARTRRELEQGRREIARADQDARDPKQRNRDAERALRAQGFARRDEIIYRIDAGRRDSLTR